MSLSKNLTKLALVAAIFSQSAAQAAQSRPCPDTLDYSNGSPMKTGPVLYYPGYAGRPGQVIAIGSQVYYPNSYDGDRGLFRDDRGRAYYPNGREMQYGRDLYYPSGAIMSDGRDTYEDAGYAGGRGRRLYAPSRTPIYMDPYSSNPNWGRNKIGVLSLRVQPPVRGQPRWDFNDLLVLEFDRLIAQGNARVTRYVPETGTVVFEFIQYPATERRPGWRVLVNMKDTGEYNCTWAESYTPNDWRYY